MLEIDGSYGEGGGQVLRSALALSLITATPCKLYNIRAGREKPGLRPQHLQAVRAAAQVGAAHVEGAALGSGVLMFCPSALRPGSYRFDIGTAGATSLVLQTVCAPLARANEPSSLTLEGGTHVPLSPCFHYLKLHWCRFLAAAGCRVSVTLERAGFYPRGGGIVHARIQPCRFVRAIRKVQRGELVRIFGISAVARLPKTIAARQRNQAVQRLGEQGLTTEIEIEIVPALSRGTFLILVAEFERTQACFFALGKRGRPAERVADEAVDALLEFLSAEGAVDPFLADQLLLPLVFADGESVLSTSRVTSHLLTNVHIVRLFLNTVLEIEGTLGQSGVIRIRPYTNGGCSDKVRPATC